MFDREIRPRSVKSTRRPGVPTSRSEGRKIRTAVTGAWSETSERRNPACGRLCAYVSSLCCCCVCVFVCVRTASSLDLSQLESRLLSSVDHHRSHARLKGPFVKRDKKGRRQRRASANNSTTTERTAHTAARTNTQSHQNHPSSEYLTDMRSVAASTGKESKGKESKGKESKDERTTADGSFVLCAVAEAWRTAPWLLMVGL